MFKIDGDKTIHLTRGDVALFDVTAAFLDGLYTFNKDDVVRFKVYERKDCGCVVLQKDVRVEEESEAVSVFLEKEETKIGELISKPKDYWYEIELNPETKPQTILGYDEAGPKVFRLYPEGDEAK